MNSSGYILFVTQRGVKDVLLLTDYTKQHPSWKAGILSASQGIPHLLRNPKVHYRVYKSPPLAPILFQFNSLNRHPVSLRSILILSSHLRLEVASVLFPAC
jgi:hypothetical protein